MSPVKKSETLKLNLRLSRNLHRQLVQAVKGDSPAMSLQQEITWRLEKSFDRKPSQEMIRILSDPDLIRYLVAKYPSLKAALVTALKGGDQSRGAAPPAALPRILHQRAAHRAYGLASPPYRPSVGPPESMQQ